MDKFEHEKHNRRERVYKFPKTNLYLTEKQAEQKERERIAQRDIDISQRRCLALYRDFFRNPRNYKYVEEYGSKRRLQNLPAAYEEDLLKGQKEFSKLEVNSAKYHEYMTPLDFYWGDESNKINYENYYAGVAAVREEEVKAQNLSMLEALKRHRFKAD
jgi:hypothetical protein